MCCAAAVYIPPATHSAGHAKVKPATHMCTAGPFGGSSATAWLVMLAGDFFKLFPLASNLLKPEVSGKWHPTVIGKSIYKFAFGLPSWGWMLPREGVLGVNHVSLAAQLRWMQQHC